MYIMVCHFHWPHISCCLGLCFSLNKCNAFLAQIDRVPDIGSDALGWFPQQQEWCRVQVAKICGVKGGNYKNHRSIFIWQHPNEMLFKETDIWWRYCWIESLLLYLFNWLQGLSRVLSSKYNITPGILYRCLSLFHRLWKHQEHSGRSAESWFWRYSLPLSEGPQEVEYRGGSLPCTGFAGGSS